MASLKGRAGETTRRAALGAAALVLGTVLMVSAYTGALRGLFEPDTRQVVAVFQDAKTLAPDSPVRLDGVEVGKVRNVESVPGARASRVEMDVKTSAGTLFSDARAKVRWRSVLGGALYVDLERGRETAGDLGDREIPARRTSTVVELDDITSAVRGDARRGLQVLPGELARALRDPQLPAATLQALAEAAPAVTSGIGPLRGTIEDRDLRTLVAAAARTTRALDTPTDDLRKVVAGAGSLLRTTAARRADLATTLHRAPSVMRRTEATLSDLDRTLSLADPLVDKILPTARDVAPTVKGLRPVVVGADRLLDRARPLLRSLRPALSSLAATAKGALPLLDELQPSLDRVDGKILPYMGEKDEVTERSASQMVGPALAGLGGSAGQQDSSGHFIRFPGTSGSSPAYLPCQAYLNNPDKPGDLADCKSFEKILETYLNWSPLSPAPGSDPPPPASRRRAGR